MYLLDFFMASIKRNSHYMIELYAGMRTDLLVATLVGSTFVLLFWLAPTPYSFTSIDIAGAGLPFFLYGLFETIQCGKIKIANQRLSQRITYVFVIIQVIAYMVSIYFLHYVLSGKASVLQSIFIQLSVLFAALTFFFGAKHIRFIFTKQKMELSPVLIELFRSIPTRSKIYEDAQVVVEIWNKEIKKAKASQRKQVRTNRKKIRK